MIAMDALSLLDFDIRSVVLDELGWTPEVDP